MQSLAEMRADGERQAAEWAAWRERDKARRATKTKQPGLPEMFAMLQEILSQIAELRAAQTSA